MKTLWPAATAIAYIISMVVVIYSGIQGDWQKMPAFTLLMILVEVGEINDLLKGTT